MFQSLRPAVGDRRTLFRLILFVLGGASGVAALTLPSNAVGSRTLIIPSNDGYGFEECLKAGAQCGVIVADAWCKAHGFGASQGFAPDTDDLANANGGAPGAYKVTCGDSVN